MELKSRQTTILRRFLENDETIDSEKLQNELKIAKRTFYYDIEHINAWLLHNHIQPIIVRGGKIGVSTEDKKKIEILLRSEKNYFLSIEERKIVTILTVALASKPVTIHSLMELLDVSKNTVLKSLKQIKEDIEEKNLALVYHPDCGYVIEGEETVIRKMIWKHFFGMTTPEGLAVIRKLLQSSLEELACDELDFYELCRCIIKQYETDLDINCFVEDPGYETMMVQVAWIRSLKGYSCGMSEEERFTLMETEPYQSVEKNIFKMKMQGIKFPEKEIYYITSILLGIEYTSQHTRQEEDAFINELVQNFVRQFGSIACMNITEPERLCKKIMHHMRPLYYRMKYGVISPNLLTNDIRRMYPDAYDFTERAIKAIGVPDMVEDEVARLCVFLIGCFGEKRIQRSEKESQTILIVNSSNVEEAQLVKGQLQKMFGLDFSCKIVSKNQLKRIDSEDYVLLVAMESLPDKYQSDKFVRISPILKDENLNMIAEKLMSHMCRNNYDAIIRNILSIFNNTEGVGDINDGVYSRLYINLFHYFNEQDVLEPMREDTIEQISARVQSWWVPDHCNWFEAVLLGGEKLQEGYENSHLVERLWNLMRKNMLQYYRFDDEMVIVHCPMHGEREKQASAQVLLSHKGINCPDGNRAKLVVCLATINSYSHWKFLYALYTYFGDKEHVENLMKSDEE